MILDIINSIYEKLEDDSSKMIFEKRLEYSISKKQSLIDDMVCHEMKRYGELDILNRCLKWLLFSFGSSNSKLMFRKYQFLVRDLPGLKLLIY